MKLPHEGSGVMVFLTAGAYHIAMMSAEMQFANLVESFSKIQTNLRTYMHSLEDVRLETMKCMAKRIKSDVELDQEVRMFELKLLELVKKDKNSAMYKKFFLKPMSAVISGPIEDEIRQVIEIENKLDGAPQEISQCKESLTQKRQTLEESVAQYKKALSKENEIKTEIKLAKIEWIKQYRIDYAELIKAFPNNMSMVANYFKRLSRKEEAEEEVEVEQPQ